MTELDIELSVILFKISSIPVTELFLLLTISMEEEDEACT
jgi:hypothetical protein